MESIKFVKGYDKVNSVEGSPDSPPKHGGRLRRIIAISLAVFLTLIIASLITALVHDHESTTESDSSNPSQLTSNSTESLKTVCSVTRYPDSCFSSISPLNSPPADDPLRFFNISLHASLLEVTSLRSELSEPTAEPAMKDCVELFDDAVSELERSAESICVGPGEKVLTEMRISDLQTWISAAMTDQDTCLDGLAEMGSTAVGEFRLKVHKSQEYMSNSLAILINIQSLFQKFGLSIP